MADVPLIIQPDAEELEAAEVLVEGSVGGRPYRFLLDTGAANTRIALDAYTVGFASLERSQTSGVFRQGSDDLISLPVVQVGPMTRRNVTVARAPAEAEHVANLIGMDVLKYFRLDFDFSEGRLTVDPSDDPRGGLTWHALTMDNKSHPYVEVQFGHKQASAVWDSGSSLTVVDATFINQHRVFFRKAGESTGTDSTGQEGAASLYIMSSAVIGDLTFPPHRVAAVDLAGVNATLELRMDLILGFSTLRHADWLLDFPNRRWAFSRMRGLQ